jgi:hypothetical protein
MMKAWITKYALSKGVFEAEVVECNYRAARRIDGPFAYYVEDDWHRTEEAAIARAEQMRTDRIASLRRQIARLEELTFRRAG